MSTVYWRKSLNPIKGCTKCSEGCAHCYALATAVRLTRMGNQKYAGAIRLPRVGLHGAEWTGEISIDSAAMNAPYHVRTPCVYFTSMGDWFHARVPDNARHAGRILVGDCPHHTFLWCTKRPARMAPFFEGFLPLPNLWLGASVCVEHEWAPACAALARLKARGWHTWLSYEPALEEPDLEALDDLRPDWVVVGAETGRGARPMAFQWADSVTELCAAAGIPVWTKALPDLADGPYRQVPASWTALPPGGVRFEGVKP